MSSNTSRISRDGNNDNSGTEDDKDTVSSTNVTNAVQECINSINLNLQSLMACHDLLRHSLISVRINSTPDHDLVNLKQLASDYKNITDELISNIDRLIKMIGVYMVVLNEDLQRKQRIRDEIEKCMNRVSSQNVIIEDAAKLYSLTVINEPRHSHSTKEYVDSREMLIRNHNLGAASLNTIKGTPVHRVKSWIVSADEKRERESQRSRALEAYYNQYIIVFPITTKTNAVGRASGGSRRRTNIPERPQNTANMWSVMKNSIGKDLSKIPMPVNFSEPISALQRLVECFEYSHILDHAADCGDALEQLAYVAAFYVSGYSTNSNRTSKPFNPLLGETFEWDRTDDYGWRVIAEQVSHHPPISALHCAAKEWTCWEDFSVVTKFRGKYLTAEPKGTVHLEFNKRDGHHYTWKKVSTTIHNIVIGRMYVEQNGEVDVIDHTNGAKCHLNFLPSGGYFDRDCKNRVFGTVKDTSGRVKWLVDGVWDKYIEIGLVTSVEGPSEKPIYKTDSKKMVWECTPLPDNSEKQYNFTLFARQLNEMEDEVAPTDSRRRPDQRLMEEGNWDEANVVKVLLEQRQRERRNAHQSSVDSVNESSDNRRSSKTAATAAAQSGTASSSNSSHQPVWFRQQVDTLTQETVYVYQKGYWEAKQKQDWSMCPNIFTTV